MKYTELPHFSHPEHNLRLVNDETPYICDGCKEPGLGAGYRCDICNFDLHKDCMHVTSSASHVFYKECAFKFFNRAPGEKERYCDACVRDVKGFVYHCDCGRDLHPSCRSLPSTIEAEGVKLHLHEKLSSKCNWCEKRKLENDVTGWSYMSNCKKYHFHVSCLKNMVMQKWEKKHFFPGNEVDENYLALENINSNRQLTLQTTTSRNGGKIRKYWRVAKIVISTIISIILGDPAVAVACIVGSIISK